MAKVKIGFWKDIPLTVRVADDVGGKASCQLPDIYMTTVDAVATRSGATSSDAYLAGFRYEQSEVSGYAQEIANAIVADLQKQFPKSWLREQRFIAGAGNEPEQPDNE